MDVFERTSARCFEGKTGTIEQLSERIIEIQITSGIELGRREAEAIQRCIRALTEDAPAALLINRRGSHALTFEAQEVVSGDDRLIAVAYLVTSTANRIIVNYSRNTYFDHVLVESFTARDGAIAWLEETTREALAQKDDAPRPEAPKAGEHG